jgi:MYXO-CTERM domain-containing protein
MTRTTRTERNAAASWFLARRAEGVPSLVTAHEAWRLSAGAIGTEGDHGATGGLPLMAVALAVARRR